MRRATGGVGFGNTVAYQNRTPPLVWRADNLAYQWGSLTAGGRTPCLENAGTHILVVGDDPDVCTNVTGILIGLG
jgi:hypothetical protein